MSIIRVAFLGTPEFARHHLEKILEDEHYEVVGVASQPDRPAGRKMRLTPSPVKELALKHNLPVITPENFKDPEVLKIIESWKAEAAVVVAFGQILPQSFLDIFPQKVVNVHGSILPRWRGAAPIQRAIMNGDQETGVSLQVMVSKLDAGPVLGYRKIELDDKIDAIELHDKMKILGASLIEIEFMDYLRGNLAAKEQDESQVTYAPKIDKSEGHIDWNLDAREISCRIRGLKMGPGSFTYRNGSKLKIHKVSIEERKSSGVPGSVSVEQDELFVTCGSNCLKIEELQPESKPKMKTEAYLRGHNFQPGEVLGES